MPFATAEDLPPELIRLVVSYLYVRDTGRYGALKRGLATCSLTCRYWASILRPLLFENIEIRSRQDAFQLQQFLESLTILKPPLSKCVRFLTLKQSAREVPPWMQLYKLAKYFRRGEIELTIDAIDGDLLWHAVPRTLPRSIFAMHVINLENMKFRQGRDLVRFIHNLPEVWSCTCKAITFQDASPVPPIRLPRRRPLESVEDLEFDMEGCTELSFETQLTVALAVRVARDRLRVGEDSWTSALAAVLALVSPDSRLRSTRVDTDDSTCWIGAYAAETSLTLRLEFTSPAIIDGVAISTLRSFAVSIDSEHALGDGFWNAFEDQLLLFHPILPLTVVVGENLATLTSVLGGTILSRMQEAGKLRLLEFWYTPRAFTKEEVGIEPAQRVVDESTLTLDAMQRIHLLGCRNAEKDEYLRDLLKKSHALKAQNSSNGGRETVATQPQS